jgi:hypothetical protein
MPKTESQATTTGHEPTTSPRKLQLAALLTAGCTNKVVAHYVIDIARNPTLATTELVDRLAGIASVPSSSINGWVSALSGLV